MRGDKVGPKKGMKDEEKGRNGGGPACCKKSQESFEEMDKKDGPNKLCRRFWSEGNRRTHSSQGEPQEFFEVMDEKVGSKKNVQEVLE